MTQNSNNNNSNSNNNASKAELLERREANESAKEESQDSSEEKIQTFRSINEGFKDIQQANTDNLPGFLIDQIERKRAEDEIAARFINNAERNINLDDPKSEVDEYEIHKARVELEIQFTVLAHNLLTSFLGPLGENYDTVKEARDAAGEQAINAIDDHIANVKEGLAIDEALGNMSDSSDNDGSDNDGGSLVDDYADPNLDQPSHMDPED